MDMDPFNYLPRSPQRLSPRSDGVHGSAASWMADPHHLAAMPHWAPLNPASPSSAAAAASPSSISPLYLTQPQPPRPHSDVEPLPFGLQGALPHPDRGLGGPQQPDGLAGLPSPSGHWAPALHPMAGLGAPPGRAADAGAASAAGYGHGHGAGGLVPHPGDMAGAGGFALQPQGAANMGPPGATSQGHSLLFSSADRLANAFGQQATSPPVSTAHHLPLSSLTPPRRAGHHSSPTTPRSQHLAASLPVPASQNHSGLPSLASDRRRQSYVRPRRYMNSRQTASDPIRDTDDDGRPTGSEARLHRRPSQATHVHWDEAAVRQLQLVRGAASSKMVASRMALQSLQSVDDNELSENERTCVICYNDYGVESPEGINEAPLRLPKCKHVFGDHCIKKWFEDSDSCPYCRDKLPSEPKHNHGSARTFMNMMRMRGVPLPPGFPEQLYQRLMEGSMGELDIVEAVARQGHLAERRSPPDDAAGDDQRRTRQRRSSPSPSRPALPPARGRSAAGMLGLLGAPPPRHVHWAPEAPPAVNSQAAARPAMTAQGEQGVATGPAGLLYAPPYPALPTFVAAGAAGSRSRPSTAQQYVQDFPGGALAGGGDGQGMAAARALRTDMQLPNPLQAHPGAGFAGEPSSSSSIPSLRPAMQGRWTRPASAGASAEQARQGEGPGAFGGANRNRPW